MTFRVRRLAVVVLVSVGLCGCSTAVETSQTTEPAGGMIELAVSELCPKADESQCTEVGGEWVMLSTAAEF
jgi:hypothetical protein